MGILFSGLIANLVLAPFALPFSLRILGKYRRWNVRKSLGISSNTTVIAFFHPYCNDGGGGERVLWRAIYAISEHAKSSKNAVYIIVYVGGRESINGQNILHRVRELFGIDLITASQTLPIVFVHVRGRFLLEPTWYPIATILGQSVGAMILACECLIRFTPDVFFDTTGWASTYLPARIIGCDVGAYVHYPTISSDTLANVRKDLYPNGWLSSRINPYLMLKLLYYHILAIAYFCMGCLTRVVMVNSRWTLGHMKKLWKFKGGSMKLVYPPCNISKIQELPLDEDLRTRSIISISKFRPEKNHNLQLMTFSNLKSRGGYDDVTMIMAGGCTTRSERKYLENLMTSSKKLGLEESVKFSVNLSQLELIKLLGSASIGLHTMWKEHFGIGIVEMMSAGIVVIAHKSGGPAIDIITNDLKKPVGYLAETAEEYTDLMCNVLDKKVDVPLLRRGARESAKRFSDEAFDIAFMKALKPLYK